MRVLCTASMVLKFAFWALVIGLALGLLAGYRANPNDVPAGQAAAIGTAGYQYTFEGGDIPCRPTPISTW